MEEAEPTEMRFKVALPPRWPMDAPEGNIFCCSNVEFFFPGPPRRVRFGKCFSHFPRHRLVFHPHREYRRFKHVERSFLRPAMIDLNGTTRGGSYHRSLFHSHQGRPECMMMTYRWTHAFRGMFNATPDLRRFHQTLPEVAHLESVAASSGYSFRPLSPFYEEKISRARRETRCFTGHYSRRDDCYYMAADEKRDPDDPIFSPRMKQ
jgi:hypothetical protein